MESVKVGRACVIYLEDSSKIGACYLGGIEGESTGEGLRQQLPAFMIPICLKKWRRCR